MTRFVAAVLALALFPTWALAATTFIANSPVEGLSPTNASATSAPFASVSITIPGAVGKQTHVYAASAWCPGGSASGSITVTDGGVTILATPPGAGGVPTVYAPTVALTAAVGATVVVTVGACSAGGTGIETLNVQADQF
jgi:hypothetical protein